MCSFFSSKMKCFSKMTPHAPPHMPYLYQISWDFSFFAKFLWNFAKISRQHFKNNNLRHCFGSALTLCIYTVCFFNICVFYW
jgi:hypothetical protein